MNEALDLRALMYACQRVEDFTRVHQSRTSAREKTMATTLWLEYIGLDGEIRDYLDQWVNRYAPDDTGPLLIGLIIGLHIRQYEREHPRSE